jgi:hypothetical protein
VSKSVPAALDRRVRLRAGNRCEYCGISQERQEATFHIDHIVPRVARGLTSIDNLALACVSCSLRKGARTDRTDPVTSESTRLFNPRQDVWSEHFHVGDGFRIVGLTSVGGATSELLQMNRPLAVEIRRAEGSSPR